MLFSPVLPPQLQFSLREATDSNLLPHLLMPDPPYFPYFFCRIAHLQRAVLRIQPSPLQSAHTGLCLRTPEEQRICKFNYPNGNRGQLQTPTNPLQALGDL